MDPLSKESRIMPLDEWIDFTENRRKQKLRLIELLENEPDDVVEIAVKLYQDGWEDDVDSLVLAAKLLGGDNERVH